LLTISFAGPVSYYGELKVRPNTPFIDGAKTKIRAQIRGVSFGWSNTGWESESFYNANAVERMAKDWKAELVRAAYGATRLGFTETDAIANRKRVETIVEAAIENDVFAIIDWHSHYAHNELEQASEFFAYMAQKYGEYDNVIFELYNEPLNMNWDDIKAYSEQIIPIIRKHSDNLILVGTPFYSQKIQDVIGRKIRDANIAYVVHFYAASHYVDFWSEDMNKAINDTIPIFITEYGTTNADGGCSPIAYGDCSADHYNTHNAERSDAWHAYMDSKKISSVAWNINDKYEGSAFFGAVPMRGGGAFDQSSPENWSDTTKMTESGKYVFKKLNEYYKTAPWNSDAVSIKSLYNKLPEFQPAASYELYTLQGKLVREPSDNGVYILITRQNGAVKSKILRVVK
ncbi:MAG: glycoside hydrolase family 5 protein, partial [Fibromonadales bacterium]|nr:glycoside hydrolase family 5 protein [Fibromonadales bacterium]